MKRREALIGSAILAGISANIVFAEDVKGSDKRFEDIVIPPEQEMGKEKHVPVIEETEKGIKVKVGSIQHPMEEAHFIQFIEVISDNKVHRKYLKPGEIPEAEFKIPDKDIIAREYCNIHGLWKT